MFGGEDAGDSGEVVGDQEVCPVGGIEEGADGGKGVVAEFEDEEASGFEMASGFGDEFGVKFVAFFAAEEGGGAARDRGLRWEGSWIPCGRCREGWRLLDRREAVVRGKTD